MYGSHKSQRHTWTFEFGTGIRKVKISGTKNKQLKEFFNNW